MVVYRNGKLCTCSYTHLVPREFVYSATERWRWKEKILKKDKDGKVIKGEDGKSEEIEVTKKLPGRLRAAATRLLAGDAVYIHMNGDQYSRLEKILRERTKRRQDTT